METAAVIYASVLALLIINSYTSNTVIFILPVLLCVNLTMRFCGFCFKNRPKITYSLGFLTVSLVCLTLISQKGPDLEFFQWIYYNVAETGYTPYYAAMFVFSCFFIPSGVFYFTFVLYRPVFLLLLTVIAYLFNDQRYVSVPAVYTALACASFFAVLMFFNNGAVLRGESAEGGFKISKKIALSFVSTVFLASFAVSFIPVGNTRSEWARNPRGFFGLSGLLNYSAYSGLGGFALDDERVLYLVDTQSPEYYIRQVFEVYENNTWARVLWGGSFDWEKAAVAANYDAFINCLKAAAPYNGLPEAVSSIDFSRSAEAVKTATVIPQGASAAYVLAPLKTFSVSGLPDNTPVARSAYDEFFAAGRGRISGSYTIGFYGEDFRDNAAYREFAAFFDADGFENVLRDTLRFYRDRLGYVPDAVTSFYDRFREGKYYFEISKGGSGGALNAPRVAELAGSITAGCVTDYDKAAAIERYFSDNGFIYDREYPKEADTDIEYFLFTSKTGICGHYATAMTILARAAGLNARYVEGFTSHEINRSNYYVIRAKYAHAFVQVFIPAYGWVTFDPTVASASGENGVAGFLGQIIENLRNYTFIIFSAFSGLIIAGACLYALYAFLIEEALFRLKVKKSKPAPAIFYLYGRVLKIIEKKLKMGNVTPGEINRAAMSFYGADVTRVTDAFSKLAYGAPEDAQTVGEAEKAAALAAYMNMAANRKTFNAEFVAAFFS